MSLLDIIIAILILGWIGGFAFRIAGGFIHILLVLAIIVFVVRLFQGR